MKKTIWFFIFLLSVSFLYSEPVLLDLLENTIADQYLPTLSVDDITNILGRPTTIRDHDLLTGHSIINYHDYGVSFRFAEPNADGLRMCEAFSVYYTRTWNEEDHRFYNCDFTKFSTIPKLNENLKSSVVIDIFDAYISDYKTAAEMTKEHSSKPWYIKGVGDFHTNNLYVYDSGSSVVFLFDEITDYLMQVNNAW